VLLQGKKAAGLPKQGTIDPFPSGSPRADLHCRNYALQQSLIPRKIDVEELATTPRARSRLDRHALAV
jgi:hypothetical protein